MARTIIEECKFCRDKIEFDSGADPGTPRWIGTTSNSYLCHGGTWEQWHAGAARGHEPIDVSIAGAA